MTPDKKSYVIKSKTVVLSAGTLESPRILLNSGIEGNAIGYYLANHSRLSAGGILARNDLPENPGILDLVVPRTEIRPFLIQILSLRLHHYNEIPVSENLRVGIDANGIVESSMTTESPSIPCERMSMGYPSCKFIFLTVIGTGR
ncbi:GMC family oxidoreductase N-terminal domain-containing protein [Paenibacillus vietnamensis]|uniref:GMC family oxidoreductase N-terminal domain-containing protein n=1 Tax=Paenibacillus vietnamensis TaxID=2590547 RepID=UPI0021E42D2C|nr:GMC family oxidoreductase N-terminal domain-containing protein [Paenibacillus vietnamensis]